MVSRRTAPDMLAARAARSVIIIVVFGGSAHRLTKGSAIETVARGSRGRNSNAHHLIQSVVSARQRRLSRTGRVPRRVELSRHR